MSIEGPAYQDEGIEKQRNQLGWYTIDELSKTLLISKNFLLNRLNQLGIVDGDTGSRQTDKETDSEYEYEYNVTVLLGLLQETPETFSDVHQWVKDPELKRNRISNQNEQLEKGLKNLMQDKPDAIENKEDDTEGFEGDNVFNDEAYFGFRQELERVYRELDELNTSYDSGAIQVNEFVHTVGSLISDVAAPETVDTFGLDAIGPHQRRVQILAYDMLAKAIESSLEKTQDDLDTLVAESVMYLEDTSVVSKKQYLTGILMHHLQNLKDEQHKKVVQSAKNVKELFDGLPEYTRHLDDIISGFNVPEVEAEEMTSHQQDIENARLISALYEGPQSITSVDLQQNVFTKSKHDDIRESTENIMVRPNSFVILPRDFHPSQRKIDESEEFNWPLGPALIGRGQNEETKPEKYEAIYFPSDDPEVVRFTKEMRFAKDQKNFHLQEKLRQEMESYVMSNLDEYGQQRVSDLQNQGHRIEIRYLTIRDKAEDTVTAETAE